MTKYWNSLELGGKCAVFVMNFSVYLKSFIFYKDAFTRGIICERLKDKKK